MPAISISFNRYLCLILLTVAPFQASASEMPTLTGEQREWLGNRIYQNECNARFECLTSWNEGEAFPSLGIGHFIWYRAGQEEIFDETFPLLLAFYREQGISLPAWLEALPGDDSPWQSRREFLAALEGAALRELREFLAATRATQVEFIVARLPQQLPALLTAVKPGDRERITRRFYKLANSAPPYGAYALVDYLHFKGSGLNPAERYQGQGWGLLQVLETMQQDSLESFATAAEAVLERRVRNAPPARNEQRWIAGWRNRVRGYIPSVPDQ